MKTMEKLEFVDENMILNMDDQAVIQLTCSRHAVRVLMELIGSLKCLGDAGSSRCINVESDNRAMFFDGDGADHIYAITLNGRSLDEWVAKQVKRNEAKQRAIDKSQESEAETQGLIEQARDARDAGETLENADEAEIPDLTDHL